MAVPSYAYLKLKMLGPCDVITIAGNFKDAINVKGKSSSKPSALSFSMKPRPDDGIKRKMSSRTSQCALLSPEHHATLVTPASVLPTFPLASASSATPVP